MTRQELAQFGHLKREVVLLEDKLHRARERALQMGRVPDGMPRGSATGDPVGVQTANIVLYETLLAQKLEECQRLLNEITAFINGIGDSLLRQVFLLRYVEGLTWNRVADRIGGGNTENSLKQMHSRYLRAHLDCHTCHTGV